MLLDCSIKRVTFYEDRAEVERRGQVTLAGGRAHLRVEGLTPLLVNDSVRIEVPPGAANQWCANFCRSEATLNR